MTQRKVNQTRHACTRFERDEVGTGVVDKELGLKHEDEYARDDCQKPDGRICDDVEERRGRMLVSASGDADGGVDGKVGTRARPIGAIVHHKRNDQEDGEPNGRKEDGFAERGRPGEPTERLTLLKGQCGVGL